MKYIKGGVIALFVIIMAVMLYLFIAPFMKKDKIAHDFTALTITGESVRFSDLYKQKGAVLVFFDTQLDQSIELLGEIVKAGGGAVNILAVPVKDIDPEELGNKLPKAVIEGCYVIPRGSAPTELYNIKNPPITHFVDRNGKVRSSYIFKISNKSLSKSLQEIA